jgi:nitrite reductase (NO-forming)
MRKFTMAGLLVLLLLSLAACGGGDAQQPGAPAEAPAAPAATDVTVEVGNDLAFHPSTVEVPAGQTLNVTMPNSGALEHNWVWEENDEVFLHANPGETDTGSITFDTAGDHPFYCSIPGHREAGMVGTVTVTQ